MIIDSIRGAEIQLLVIDPIKESEIQLLVIDPVKGAEIFMFCWHLKKTRQEPFRGH